MPRATRPVQRARIASRNLPNQFAARRAGENLRIYDVFRPATRAVFPAGPNAIAITRPAGPIATRSIFATVAAATRSEKE